MTMMTTDDVPVRHVGSFSEVMTYVALLGWTRSQLSMRLKRERDASPERENGQCPRPKKYVSNGTVPLWDLRQWDEFVRVVRNGVGTSS
ncbi:MAG: hypothetical protein ACOYEV_18920 [Candidatus Nanopelagicales bacterium]